MNIKIGENKYEIKKSDKPYKKLMVVKFNNKPVKVHFGASGYEHYFDKTGILPKSLNHLDKKRRERYKKRHHKDDLKDPLSPGFLSMEILW